MHGQKAPTKVCSVWSQGQDRGPTWCQRKLSWELGLRLSPPLTPPHHGGVHGAHMMTVEGEWGARDPPSRMCIHGDPASPQASVGTKWETWASHVLLAVGWRCPSSHCGSGVRGPATAAGCGQSVSRATQKLFGLPWREEFPVETWIRSFVQPR